jgi:ribosome-interacting GTPase 1
MPANLPPQYFEAERRYREAKTTKEKIALLQEMMAIMPKHKGTEKLQADLKTRISKLKREALEQHAKTGHGRSFYIEKQGAGQVILLGPPNTGKSSILKSLTKATPSVAPYPFTTKEPEIGMMEFEDIKFQLVDAPPVVKEHTEPWLLDIFRRADLLALVVDLSDDGLLDGIEMVLAELHKAKFKLGKEELSEAELVEGWVSKQVVLVGNKADAEGAGQRFIILKEIYEEKFPVIAVSTQEGSGMSEFKSLIYRILGIIRVYTKTPGKPIDRHDPIVLKKGETLLDAARSIHKDFGEKMKFARLWRGEKYQGLRVEQDQVLEDGDVVEFHIK